MISHEVPASLREENLQRYIRRAWPLLPGHVLRELMKKKDVRVNGIKCGKDDSVRGGDLLEIFADSRYFEILAEVIYDDGHLLAAVKP